MSEIERVALYVPANHSEELEATIVNGLAEANVESLRLVGRDETAQLEDLLARNPLRYESALAVYSRALLRCHDKDKVGALVVANAVDTPYVEGDISNLGLGVMARAMRLRLPRYLTHSLPVLKEMKLDAKTQAAFYDAGARTRRAPVFEPRPLSGDLKEITEDR